MTLGLLKLEEVKSAWEKSIHYQAAPANVLDPAILQSWYRCRDYGVDHQKSTISKILSPNEFLKKYAPIRNSWTLPFR